MSENQYVIEVGDRTFDQEVLQRSRQTPVLVDFWAAWCAPCKALTPVLDKLATDYAGAFILAKVNTDEHQQLAMQCGIRSLPTVILVKDGQIVDGFVGAQPDHAIRELLEKHGVTAMDNIPSEEPAPRVVADDDRKQVIGELRSVLDQKPNDEAAILELAELLIIEEQYAEIEVLLNRLPEDKAKGAQASRLAAAARLGEIVAEAPGVADLSARVAANAQDSEAHYFLAIRKALAGDHEAALDLMLGLVQRDRKFRDDAARKTMVEMFALLGGTGPLVKQYRSRLYSALN